MGAASLRCEVCVDRYKPFFGQRGLQKRVCNIIVDRTPAGSEYELYNVQEIWYGCWIVANHISEADVPCKHFPLVV
jgi:hypothetical protein